MIELIFVACLKLASGSCEERSHLHMAEIGIMGCMLTAQALVADWSGAHPEFRGSLRSVLPIGQAAAQPGRDDPSRGGALAFPSTPPTVHALCMRCAWYVHRRNRR